ncbi:hypothetical protein PHLCEN_2v10046 [Hermanssonia centrifuga]|uniref:Uncharacterized protein n=1 Tax=Hermanssonia centrifuga TaxID=98765 RepID=A0A2R6NNQ8_9APHY|nr:hypothetical protein PHLCEN_2v10046 [Hermanssonia centrifuga]
MMGIQAQETGQGECGARSTLNAIPLPYPSSSHSINTSLNWHQLLTRHACACQQAAPPGSGVFYHSKGSDAICQAPLTMGDVGFV